MDIMLNRVLSLIGDKRGAKKELAEYIGISPNVITAWISGTNESYKKHASKIAEFYGVSIAWIHGETDIKKDTASNNADDAKLKQFEDIVNQLSPKGVKDLLWFAQSLVERERSE